MARLSALGVGVLLASIGCGGADCPPSGAITRVRARDATHVEVQLRCDPGDVAAGDFAVGDYRVAPPTLLDVTGADSDGPHITVTTTPQQAEAQYTLRWRTQSANFVGVGDAASAPVTFVVDDRYNQSLTAVRLLVTFDPETGFFSPYENTIDLTPGDDHILRKTVNVAVAPLRTIDTSDDRLGQDHVAYGARAIDPKTQAALSKLVTFEVRTADAFDVNLPLLTVPPPPPPEGLVDVTIDVDDSPARALSAPTLRASIDADGVFDASFPTRLDLTPGQNNHYTAHTRVRIDPNRVRGGNTSSTYPYTFYISDTGTDYPNVHVEIEAKDESAQQGTIRIGNAALVPVTFRVDISRAYLTLDGSVRGHYPGESLFLTGQWAVAEDAFGRNASDAFTGGENLVLEMKERADHPGVWTRTLFLSPNRPYGWKVVRCPAGVGCADLNRHVISSGRAFATVVKNLATQNLDGSTHPETDLIDPRAPGNYGGASLYRGRGMGVEGNPPGIPNPQTLFKQEAPDLVVSVTDQPLATPVYVIGTWRDVNLPQKPADIIAMGGIFDLNAWDYDAGFVGRGPPTYQLDDNPPVMFNATDGTLDMAARQVSPGIYVAKSGTTLYVATSPPGGGLDRFLFVAPTRPAAGTTHPAMWGKAGTLPFDAGAVFLAGENDNTFAGWFHYGAGGNDTGFMSAVGRGAVLEGTIDLGLLGTPGHVFLCAVSYGTADAGALDAASQRPAGNGDGNVDPMEVIDVDLSTL
jgi:hypothetical protein